MVSREVYVKHGVEGMKLPGTVQRGEMQKRTAPSSGRLLELLAFRLLDEGLEDLVVAGGGGQGGSTNGLRRLSGAGGLVDRVSVRGRQPGGEDHHVCLFRLFYCFGLFLLGHCDLLCRAACPGRDHGRSVHDGSQVPSWRIGPPSLPARWAGLPW